MAFESFLGVNPWDAGFTLANTLTIFFVAKKFLFKPVMKMITDRQKEIDEMYRAAEAAESNARTLEAEYAQKLSEAKITGERIVREAVSRGQSREEEILRKAGEEADFIRAKASADIAQEKRKAINDAKNEISELAMEIAQKVVGREMRKEDHEKLVSEFIDGLGEAL